MKRLRPIFNSKFLKGTVLASCLLFTLNAEALTFYLPRQGDVVGEIQMTSVRRGESLGDIGRRYDVGVYEMIEANPGLDPWVPRPGSTVVIPTQYVLPSGPRKGIVINIAEMRLYYYHPDKAIVSTYPLGIGKKGWSTPLVQSTIVSKKKNPTWVPPESIRREHIAKGDPLPAAVPPGPDNPMGKFALYLGGNSSIRIHGTNRAFGIGVRGSHGCIRMFPEDIEMLYYTVPVGTGVRVIHEPFKVGWHKGRLYLEAHQPLSEGKFTGSDSSSSLARAIQRVIEGSHVVNWTSAQMTAKTANGYPSRID
jgi:L,D-transpeptidase ErfK/SrfK